MYVISVYLSICGWGYRQFRLLCLSEYTVFAKALRSGHCANYYRDFGGLFLNSVWRTFQTQSEHSRLKSPKVVYQSFDRSSHTHTRISNYINCITCFSILYIYTHYMFLHTTWGLFMVVPGCSWLFYILVPWLTYCKLLRSPLRPLARLYAIRIKTGQAVFLNDPVLCINM